MPDLGIAVSLQSGAGSTDREMGKKQEGAKAKTRCAAELLTAARESRGHRAAGSPRRADGSHSTWEAGASERKVEELITEPLPSPVSHGSRFTLCSQNSPESACPLRTTAGEARASPQDPALPLSL